ncbi:uncharacterized protein C8A04DRAFT_13132 [Dichotomopilus funicola]|uniref:Uncharacterized protein n=1 Tax=Dichotomopilus funicola TaxID=1934379 RepID=A0AAN6V0K1_9PEZI|nr:hypothetical protein C8A04DRAFT_13132 [Dichotomopilus funicola]
MSTNPPPIFTDDDVIHERGPKRLPILFPIYLNLDGKPNVSRKPKVVPPPTYTTTTTSDSNDKSSGLNRPLASTPRHPEAYYSQHQCPICDRFIAIDEGADYIGHLKCLHRGTCPRPECMLAYYGRTDKWVGLETDTPTPPTTYKQEAKLFCQAPGCKEEIESWCLVKARRDIMGGSVIAVSTHEPGVDEAWEEAVARVKERRKEEDRRRMKEWKKELKREQREKKKEEREEKKEKKKEERKEKKGLFW